MGLPNNGWTNKDGTGKRSPECKTCGPWKDHWCNHTGKDWPDTCSVKDCYNDAEVGAHIINSNVVGERIAPFCKPCNNKGKETELTLKGETSLSKAVQNTAKCKKTE